MHTRGHTDACDHLRHCFLEFVDQTFFMFHQVSITSTLNSRDRVNDFKTLKGFSLKVILQVQNLTLYPFIIIAIVRQAVLVP